MAVNLPKIVETPYFSRYCKSTKGNRNVTMTFTVNLSLGCFRRAALLVVTLNMESRKPMGRVYPENRFKKAKARGSERVNVSYDSQRNVRGWRTSKERFTPLNKGRFCSEGPSTSTHDFVEGRGSRISCRAAGNLFFNINKEESLTPEILTTYCISWKYVVFTFWLSVLDP